MGLLILNYPLQLFQIPILSLFFIKNHFLNFEQSRRRFRYSREVSTKAFLDKNFRDFEF